VTKDRRLGKGLAALLGTPLEEDGIVDGVPSSAGQLTAGTERRELSAPVAAVQPPKSRAVQPGSVSVPNAPSSEKPSGARRDEVTGAVPLKQLAKSARGAIEISVSEIDNNPFQPRRKFNEAEIESLAESIREHEQLQPILVRPVGERYQLISGERRLRATIRAGLKTIRAEVREADDRLVAELAIVENLQRKDLDAIEKALSFRRYIDEHQCTQEDLAKRLKIDRSTIANLMRLLELPQEIQSWVQQERITAGHARALLPLGEEDQQIEFAQRIVSESWNVRDTERRVSEQLNAEDNPSAGKGKPAKSRSRTTAQIASLEQQLRLSLGTKVEIRQNARGRGKISISFANPEEFERVCALLCPKASGKAA
jgi:ParB family transcriptional regulator, chromosome partitioning protein